MNYHCIPKYALFIFVVAISGFTAFAEPLRSQESITVSDETRSYVLVRPNKVDPDRTYPVIIGFHGYRGEVKTWLSDYARFAELVTDKQFLVVYPEAPIQWSAKAEGRDVKLFDALVQKLKSDYRIDEKRMYVVGHSNGAAFASYLVQVRPEVIAAAALHSGILSPGMSHVPVPEHKAPLIVFWGENDEMTPAGSERVRNSIADFQRTGFEISLTVLPKWGHSWGGKPNKVEEKIISFFYKHPFDGTGRDK